MPRDGHPPRLHLVIEVAAGRALDVELQPVLCDPVKQTGSPLDDDNRLRKVDVEIVTRIGARVVRRYER